MGRELMLEACLAGQFGQLFEAKGGAVALAGFCYLLGEPGEETLRFLRERCMGRLWIPKSTAWAARIGQDYPAIQSVKRTRMEADGFDRVALERLTDLPDGSFWLEVADEPLYQREELHIGRGYAGYEDFREHGVGYVARHISGEIACVACTFLTFDRAAEVDVSTRPEFRRKGLARSSCARLILSCLERALSPNWDAQNEASVALAQTLGYRVSGTYTGYYQR